MGRNGETPKQPFFPAMIWSHSIQLKHPLYISKNFPTDPWSIPQTPNQQFMFGNSFHLGVWGCLGYAPGVCWGSLRIFFRTKYSGQITRFHQPGFPGRVTSRANLTRIEKIHQQLSPQVGPMD